MSICPDWNNKKYTQPKSNFVTIDVKFFFTVKRKSGFEKIVKSKHKEHGPSSLSVWKRNIEDLRPKRKSQRETVKWFWLNKRHQAVLFLYCHRENKNPLPGANDNNVSLFARYYFRFSLIFNIFVFVLEKKSGLTSLCSSRIRPCVSIIILKNA